MSKRILVIANKAFEADPLMSAAANQTALPKEFPPLGSVVWPRKAPTTASDVIVAPRAILDMGQGVQTEFWCIQDLMDPQVQGGSSNTQEKARVLPSVFQYGDGSTPVCVIAFGTAATPGDAKLNGAVMIGSRTFLHNPYASDPSQSPSRWNSDAVDRVLDGGISGKLFDSITPDLIANVQSHMIAVRGRPDPSFTMSALEQGVAVSSVNVVDYTQYPTTDPAALNAATQECAAPILSFESTHGVIRVQSTAPFLFFSGITNRVGHFADENLPYTQNFVASHNAAIALLWCLPIVASDIV